jgi:O-antigen/teichoic acid export membrane protein
MASQRNILLKSVFRSDFARNTSTLVSGTVLAQLIPILIQPVIRRFYSAELFGAYAVYNSLIGILYVITSLRYEQAIILPKKDEEAVNIFSLAQLINLLLSIVFLILMLVFYKPLLAFINISEEYFWFLLAVPLTTFLFNLQQSINLWLIRKKAFLSVSKNKVARRSAEGVFQITFRYLKLTYGLLLGDLIGHLANSIYGLKQIFKNGFRIKLISRKEIKHLSKAYIDYPKYNTFSTFLNACSLLLPTIIINKFYGSENAAYFDLARLLLLTPIALIASSISNVMLQRISEKHREKLFFKKELLSIIGIGILIALGEMIIILPFGEQLFGIAFGTEWTFSGTIAKQLMWPFLLYFISFSFTSLFLALQKVKALSVYQVINFLLILSLWWFTHLSFEKFISLFVYFNIISALLFAFLLSGVVIRYKRGLHSNV